MPIQRCELGASGGGGGRSAHRGVSLTKGYRTDAVVRVTVVPPAPGDRGLEQNGNSPPRALVVDDVHCAELLDAIPMAAPML
jgi:hypothetical protein